MLRHVTPHLQTRVDLPFNTYFQLTNVTCPADVILDGAHLYGLVIGVVDPVRFNERLEITAFIGIFLRMTFQVSTDAEASHQVAVSFVFNHRPVVLTV
ncbi:hypothetical protein SDC9_190791 [bioreactor metagenome]|uniref:Uncharacterized protein n=1 Tax=bioreactor metagenome TaxID=1076179 RepID=A0A645HXJ7_9ZZZZ